jgi:hypothetical protein
MDEPRLRLEAAKVWIDHGLDGDCPIGFAVEGATKMLMAARLLLDKEG